MKRKDNRLPSRTKNTVTVRPRALSEMQSPLSYTEERKSPRFFPPLFRQIFIHEKMAEKSAALIFIESC